MRFIAPLILAVLALAGCQIQSVPAVWAAQNSNFNQTIVQGVLLPHYLDDPNVPTASKANVQAAVSGHTAAIAGWEDGQ